MMNRTMRMSLAFAGALMAGALTAPAFAQSYGAMPRGYCAKQTRVSAAPTTRFQQHSAYVAGDAASTRETRRPRKARGFGSPF